MIFFVMYIQPISSKISTSYSKEDECHAFRMGFKILAITTPFEFIFIFSGCLAHICGST